MMMTGKMRPRPKWDGDNWSQESHFQPRYVYIHVWYIYVQVFRFRYRRCSAQTQHHASSVHRVPSKDGNSVTNFVWSVPMSMGRTMHCRGNVPAVDLICTGEIWLRIRRRDGRIYPEWPVRPVPRPIPCERALWDHRCNGRDYRAWSRVWPNNPPRPRRSKM